MRWVYGKKLEPLRVYILRTHINQSENRPRIKDDYFRIPLARFCQQPRGGYANRSDDGILSATQSLLLVRG